MRKFLFLVFIGIISKSAISQQLWQINKDTVITWYYQDGDEFNDSTLNTDIWKYWYGWARTIFSQKEQQYYTDGKNLELKDGRLNIFAIREKTTARVVDWNPDNDTIKENGKFDGLNKRSFNYTSGMIQTKRDYLYGYFEIKFKMQKAKGYWPAFWLYGGTPNEEIDWMELKTEKPNAIHVGRHSQKSEENRIRNYIRKKLWGDWVYFKGNLTDGDNIISGEWTPTYLKYYLNGECIAYTKLNLHTPKVLCANLAVPSSHGPYHPGPDTSIINSGNYEIDYIRTWTSNQEKEKRIDIKNHHPKSNSDNPILTSKLKSKTRFYYGKKSEHETEGVTVSIFPDEKNTYILRLLGKEIPTDANFKIADINGNVLLSSNLKYGSNKINLNPLTGSLFILSVESFNQKVTYPLGRLD